MANIEKLLQQRAQIDARIQAAKARLSQAERKDDTRRKVLLGAFVLEALGGNVVALELNGRKLADFIRRDADRALLGLPSLAAATAPATGDQADTRTG